MKKDSLAIRIGRKLRPLFLNEGAEKVLKQLLDKKPDNTFLEIMIPPSYNHKKDTIRKTICNGLNMELNLRHYNDHQTYWFSEKDVLLKNILKMIQKNDVVMDIGTNIGLYLLNFGKKANEGTVYGFEPNPKVYGYVKNNCNLNSLQNIKLNNIGLGHSKGVFEMAQINDNLGMNKIVASGSKKNTFSIKVDRLDDFVSHQNISRIDLMKIDVEGFEMNVLLGAETSIDKWKPYLFIEIDEENLNLNNTSFKAMEQWLCSKGYRIMNAITLQDLTNEEVIHHFDILAVHSEKTACFSKLTK